MLNPILFCLNDQLHPITKVCTPIIILLSLCVGYWHFKYQVLWRQSGSVHQGMEAGHLHPNRVGIQPAGAPLDTAFFTPFGAISFHLQRRYFLSRQLILLGSSGDRGGWVPLHALLLGEPLRCAVKVLAMNGKLYPFRSAMCQSIAKK